MVKKMGLCGVCVGRGRWAFDVSRTSMAEYPGTAGALVVGCPTLTTLFRLASGISMVYAIYHDNNRNHEKYDLHTGFRR